MRILIADDNSELRAALRLLLAELGEHDIVEAADWAGLLTALPAELLSSGRNAGSLLLLDWELPTGDFSQNDRFALLATIRQTGPCRIIAMSARPEGGDESLRAGCDDFISRTDPPDRLVGLVRALQDSRGGPDTNSGAEASRG
jgi:CheY-like chemotaxis protein